MKRHDLYLADLFCGGGGFSTGIGAACQRLGHGSTDTVAVNHWKIAAETYRRNHPKARVLCTGLDTINPTNEVPKGRLNLLAASPECTDHSNARGGKPCSDQRRSSAWLILKWLQELYVESVLIENVHEFEDWGPLGANGRPLKSMRGQLFQQFIASLKALGYNVEWRSRLNSANYGAYTARERLFVMARRGKNRRIIWPDATHAVDADVQIDMFSHKAKWRAAREIIDWSLPSQSIFLRKRPLARSTLERIAAGLRKFGGKNADPFLVVLRNHMDAQSIDGPIPTLTAGGNHVGLCQPFIIPQFGDAVARSVDRPLGTITTTSRGIGLCQPFIVPFFGERDGQSPRCHDINAPLPTVTGHGAGGLVEPFIVNMEHGKAFIVPTAHGLTKDGGRRVYSVDRPMPTITTADAWGVVEPYLIEYRGNHAGRDDGHHRVRPLDQDTSNRFGLVEPFIVSYYGTTNVSRVDEPLPTCTTKPRFGLVELRPGVYMDIHFRMLQWQELAMAMGFPPGYDFAGTRDQKVMQIGNAVECNVAEALAISALAS